uniref:Reverse transcriptase zinc-binding domain-containing protein n=1 Tax=Triticum urartu TaxID=4572 RepID=A0A8R7UQF7_TRIUA
MRKYINSIQLGVGDQVYWGLNGNGRFSTKSMYKWLENPLSGCHYRWIWKAKIPLKIKIFLWQLSQDAVLTRQVMKERRWPGDPKCSFCDNTESSRHLFFTCPVAKVVWHCVGMAL